ncbi:MAG TPA: urate hydroxylase PuuD, partial [Giesbergeria sp.]|nr:urate hydroxylase PuuD [Giesbergeria sp.]
PIHGKRGKQRSVHNTYFTLPVLFAMLSGHYSFTWSHPQNWLVLILMMAAGAAIRQFFVLRHGFKLGRNAHPWPYALVGVALVAAVVAWLRPAPVANDAIKNIATGAQSMGVAADFDYNELQAVLQQRCVQCHGAEVQMKGLRLDVPEQVASRASLIYQQVVQQKLMPLNNATQMTEAERALVARWFQAGAPVR